MSNLNAGERHGKTFDVFVGLLKADKTEDWARDYFSQYGPVDSTSLRAGTKDDGTGILFVRFKDKASGARAIEGNSRVDWGRVSGASRGGTSWYDVYKSERGDKRSHDGHQAIHKPDRVATGHAQRQLSAGSDKMNIGGVKLGDIIRKEEIVLSFHEGPLVFWGQPVSRSAELQDLSEQLQLVCPSGQSVTGIPNIDKIYATVFSVDAHWYRCKISKIVSETQMRVTFIDFGNTEVKSVNDIKELLPNLAVIPPLAHRYCLYGLRPLHTDKDSLGFVQGCQKLLDLTNNITLVANVCHSNTRGIIPVILEAGTVDINQEMLNSMFAETLKVKGQLQGHVSPSQAPQDHVSVNHVSQVHKNQPPALMGTASQITNNLKVGQWVPETMESTAADRSQRGIHGVIPPSGQSKQTQQSRHQSQMSNHNDIASSNNNHHSHHVGPGGEPWASMADGSGMNQAGTEIARLHRVVNLAKQETHQITMKFQAMQETALTDTVVLKREWDNTAMELEAAKTNLRSLQEDYTTLIKERTERSLSQRLARLVLSVERVKSYRVQFPTEEQCEDPIEQAFKVANDSAKIVTSQLPISKVVERAHSIYRTTMNAIRGAENADGLNDLIAARDQSRKDLYEALVEFIKSASQLPLSQRSQQVEQMLGVLAKTYKDFLRKDRPVMEDINTFEQAITTYREWKCQKTTEFSEARTRTNTCHNGINNALRTLQQQLSLDTVSETSLSTCGSLDQLLDGLQEAVDEEARKTNLVSDVNESDTLIVATLLNVVDRELRRELVDIVHLRRLLAENSSLLANIEPWLTKKVSLDDVMAVRKNIKSLKSKLRHKLADLEDLEEDCDGSDNEELKTLRDELAAIRIQLHTTFFREDEILANLAELNESHFPELSLLHADFNLPTVKQYSGIVKQGRALDQFLIQPMPGTKKKNIYKAVFCDKDYVLKEYIIDDTLGVKKSEFLRRAYFYNQIINLHILPIEALFFTGAGRQAYVQLPYYDKNLSDLLEEGPLSMECAYHILYKVLVGLQAIHSANLVFGAIHPNNVLLQDNNPQSIVLAELDLSKSPHQRTSSFTTKSHLCFQPPEFHREEISWASDMYNLGLLALWLHFPSYKFTLRKNGVPDFSPLEMDRSLEQLLVSLLQDEPSSRRMASSTWQLPYFANSPHSRPNSPRPSPEEQTLQLRPKAEGRSTPKNGGILKNKNSVSPSSSPVLLSPQSPHKVLADELENPTTSQLLSTETTQPEEDNFKSLSPRPVVLLHHVEPDTESREENIADNDLSVTNKSIDEENLLTDRFMNEESAGSTPVLVSSPQGTPMNTPVERQSECSSPPDGQPLDESQRAAVTTGLVKTAMLQCASLEMTNGEMVQINDTTNSDISDGPNNEAGMQLEVSELGLSQDHNDVADLFAEIATKTAAFLAANEQVSDKTGS